MTYVITEPCVAVKDKSCVDVCPVDCIHADDADQMLFIDPNDCIDCGACLPECPVEAIFPAEEVPDQWSAYTEVNREYFNMDRTEFTAKYKDLVTKVLE